jgi:hypothetical protein
MDIEYRGIRAYQGNGTVTIDWSRIDTLTITGRKTDVTPYRLQGEIVLKDKTQRRLELVFDSKKGLHGQTDLGEFSLPLQNVTTIVVIKTGGAR